MLGSDVSMCFFVCCGEINSLKDKEWVHCKNKMKFHSKWFQLSCGRCFFFWTWKLYEFLFTQFFLPWVAQNIGSFVLNRNGLFTVSKSLLFHFLTLTEQRNWHNFQLLHFFASGSGETTTTLWISLRVGIELTFYCTYEDDKRWVYVRNGWKNLKPMGNEKNDHK